MFIRRIHLIGLLALCFLAGGIVGTVYDSLTTGYSKGKRSSRTRISSLVKQIDLSEAQKIALEKILEDGKKSMIELNKKVRPEFGRIHARIREEIRQILTPEQRVQFDKLIEEHEQRRKERGDSRHGMFHKGADGHRANT